MQPIEALHSLDKAHADHIVNLKKKWGGQFNQYVAHEITHNFVFIDQSMFKVPIFANQMPRPSFVKLVDHSRPKSRFKTGPDVSIK